MTDTLVEFIAEAVNGVGRKFGSGLKKAVPGLSEENFSDSEAVKSWHACQRSV